MGAIKLTGRGRRWILGGHPWVYADDVAGGEGEPGELVPVHDPHGSVLGWGLFSSASKICIRFVTREAAPPDRAFWLGRVRRAIEARERLGLLVPGGACRLIAGDAEGLPGFVVDRYADVLVLSSGCQGSDRLRDLFLELLEESLPFAPRAVLDRSDTAVRRLEALAPRVEWLRGAPVETVEVVEEERDGDPCLVYEVAPAAGHKTGHYLDQVLNRRRAARHARGTEVLDAFSYDGLFGVRAALAGARAVLCLDQSAAAGERLARNAERNGVADRVVFARADAMRDLRRRGEAGERYGLVIVDPPAFARNRREAAGAARGYRELNRRAMGLVAEGGVLVSASCSYNVRREEFLEHLTAAALAAGREARLLELTAAGPDHPVLLGLPESGYLKCAFLRM
ncbi:MAG: class I SAM-dependent rRNA methyltransferase [Planctomycetota bacterium]